MNEHWEYQGADVLQGLWAEDTGIPTGFYVRETLDGEELVMTDAERVSRALCLADWEGDRNAWEVHINNKGRDHYRKLAAAAMAELGLT